MSGLKMPNGQNVEEILAFIRKSLANPAAPDEAPAAAPAPAKGIANGSAGATPAAPAATPAAPDSLSGKLADALKRTAPGKEPADDDLSDLLAPVPDTRGHRPATGSRSADDNPDARDDPLWFLQVRPGRDDPPPPPEPELAKPTAPASAPAPAPASAPAATASISLSRPETLRPRLPPLFGSRSSERPIESLKPAEPAAAAPKPDSPATGEAAPIPAMEARPAPAQPAPAPPAAVVDTPDEREPDLAAPIAPNAPDLAAAAPTPMPAAETADLPPASPLEEMIGQLLEPMLRQWLDKNLPAMVDAVIREEVARGLKGGARRGSGGELKI